MKCMMHEHASTNVFKQLKFGLKAFETNMPEAEQETGLIASSPEEIVKRNGIIIMHFQCTLISRKY